MSTRSGRAFSFAKEKTGESDSDFNNSNDEFEQNYLTECLDIVKENARTLKERLKPNTVDEKKISLEKKLKLNEDLPSDLKSQILEALKSAKLLQESVDVDFQDKVSQIVTRQRELLAKNRELANEKDEMQSQNDYNLKDDFDPQKEQLQAIQQEASQYRDTIINLEDQVDSLRKDVHTRDEQNERIKRANQQINNFNKDLEMREQSLIDKLNKTKQSYFEVKEENKKLIQQRDFMHETQSQQESQFKRQSQSIRDDEYKLKKKYSEAVEQNKLYKAKYEDMEGKMKIYKQSFHK